ncbi:TetR/AcrR family transcriptional regulator [Mycolicibacterium septicum]|uniref:TetR/AcrR family transcriptional regulator n=1 Tax=Mycolicibacterium septicum TaxID=98668 RepID=UPI002362E009|nr:TetR/AcrR family transcriptional regulator [Mycolicibacterium septicum]
MSESGTDQLATDTDASAVPADLVDAALRAADSLGKDVADVPVVAIAAEAGISRSTLLRRLGGTRIPLDDAVRAAGHDPGGLPPVRVRALDAAAALISESGLAAATLDAIAVRAQCSVFSLHAAFGSRDELMRLVFERHSPVLDIEEYLGGADNDLRSTVLGLYQTFAAALNREPRVVPAMFAEAFARPNSPAVQSLFSYTGPRVFSVLGRWFADEIDAGNLRDLPVVMLTQQFLGPMMFHIFTRPALPPPLPALDEVCEFFADTFLHAAATPTGRRSKRRHHVR